MRWNLVKLKNVEMPLLIPGELFFFFCKSRSSPSFPSQFFFLARSSPPSWLSAALLWLSAQQLSPTCKRIERKQYFLPFCLQLWMKGSYLLCPQKHALKSSPSVNTSSPNRDFFHNTFFSSSSSSSQLVPCLALPSPLLWLFLHAFFSSVSFQNKGLEFKYVYSYAKWMLQLIYLM